MSVVQLPAAMQSLLVDESIEVLSEIHKGAVVLRLNELMKPRRPPTFANKTSPRKTAV